MTGLILVLLFIVIGFFYLKFTSESSKRKRARKAYQKKKNKPIKISPEQQAMLDRVDALTPSGDPIEWQRNYKRERNLADIIAWKKQGIKKVEIYRTRGQQTCAGGMSHMGIHDIDHVPILPCKDCDSPNCLCWYSPIYEWND